MSRFVVLVVLTFAIAAASVSSHAAESTSAGNQPVTGIVKDALGRPLSNVRLNLQAADGRLVSHTITNAAGLFSFTAVAPGTYAILAEKSTFKTATAIVTVANAPPAPVVLALESAAALDLAVVAKRLDVARNSLSPETGSSTYRFSEQAISQLPQSENTPLNQVILQAPGAAQDSFGQLHIRGEHGNLQYRINGVQLPEGIAGFGQSISPRLAGNISLLTGALPAQYGLRTAGVIDIQTKSGTFANGGNVEMYGGQRGTVQPSFEQGGTSGNFSYYTTGTYIGTDHGIEPPTAGPTSIHNHSDQGLGFGYFSYLLNPTTRLSLVSGVDVNSFQIPANPGQDPAFMLNGVTNFPSSQIAESQMERTFYNVLALQGALNPQVDYQIAAFSRYSSIDFSPDPQGDLIYNGNASRVFRSSFANGLQGDAAYRLNDTHTLRAGFYGSAEPVAIDNHALVFPADDMGNQCPNIPGMPPCNVPGNVPIRIVDNTNVTSWLYGVYLQDEWRPIQRLTINYGIRYDLNDSFVHADQFSPRAGAVYEFPTQTTLHAAYARYFTPPATELISATSVSKFDGTTGAFTTVAGNTFNVKPERAHYADVGITQQLGSGFSLGVDSYFKYADHLIDEGQFGTALIFSDFNYKRGRVYGTEATGSYTHGNLSTYVNFAYSVAQGTQVESGQFNFDPDELAYISKHYIFLDHDQTFTATGGAFYDLYGYKLRFDFLYGSGLRSGFANTGNLPFYIQANVGVSKRLTVPYLGWVEARVDCINLGDETYLLRDGSGIGVGAPQFGPRRTIFAGLRVPLPFTAPTAG
ncbi:MAG TPA: TonB-dependent receptor [Candidatus Binatia bacterium]|nr:TonB-dependent receptor [Candidatus Binatia bacterium]